MNDNKLEKAVKDLQERMNVQDQINKVTFEIQERQCELNEENSKTLRNLCIFAILQCVVLFLLILKIFGG